MPLSTILGLLLRSLLLLQCLPFVTADQQQPLKDTGGIVARITQANWQRKLSPKLEGPEEWLLYNTGNKSCYGRCAAADEAWSKAVPLLIASPTCPHLGRIDCDKEDVLCTAWGLGVPSIWHFALPARGAGDQPTPKSPLRIVQLNATTVTAEEIVALHTENKILGYEEYEGAFHPIDGALTKFQLLMPLGYLLWGFGSTPTWLLMVAISFFTRQFVARRAQQRPGFGMGVGGTARRQAAPAAAAAAAPGAAAAVAGAAKQGAGSARKRKS